MNPTYCITESITASGGQAIVYFSLERRMTETPSGRKCLDAWFGFKIFAAFATCHAQPHHMTIFNSDHESDWHPARLQSAVSKELQNTSWAGRRGGDLSTDEERKGVEQSAAGNRLKTTSLTCLW